MKTITEDEFDDMAGAYRVRYLSAMTSVADAFRRAGSFGSRNA